MSSLDDGMRSRIQFFPTLYWICRVVGTDTQFTGMKTAPSTECCIHSEILQLIIWNTLHLFVIFSVSNLSSLQFVVSVLCLCSQIFAFSPGMFVILIGLHGFWSLLTDRLGFLPESEVCQGWNISSAISLAYLMPLKIPWSYASPYELARYKMTSGCI